MQQVSEAFRSFIEREEPVLAQGLVDALETTAPSVAVRLNRRKLGVERPSVLDVDGVGQVPWCADGFYLPSRPDFTHDPSLHQGLYYVQDASSMVISRVVASLGGGGPVRYLDACAAPGGKTTAAIDALPDGSLVVANEYDFRRAEILKENVIKWGYPATVVCRGDTSRFRALPGWFDIIAADVPCSGEGMMRKDETARLQWSEALVRECASRQREILDNLWGALRPGGHLIYSTCTFNRQENEEMVLRFMEATGAGLVDVPLPDGCGVVVRRGMMRFLPTRLRGEGLFMAVLRKPDGDMGMECRSGQRKKARKGRQSGGGNATRPDVRVADVIKACRGWLPAGYDLMVLGEEVVAFPAAFSGELAELSGALDVIYRGVTVGTVKGRNVVPSQSLAMSMLLHDCCSGGSLSGCPFPVVEVDLPTALCYLRRESLGGFDAPRGHLLLACGGHPLGFVNNLGNRANNLYPAQWRILK